MSRTLSYVLTAGGLGVLGLTAWLGYRLFTGSIVLSGDLPSMGLRLVGLFVIFLVGGKLLSEGVHSIFAQPVQKNVEGAARPTVSRELVKEKTSKREDRDQKMRE